MRNSFSVLILVVMKEILAVPIRNVVVVTELGSKSKRLCNNTTILEQVTR